MKHLLFALIVGASTLVGNAATEYYKTPLVTEWGAKVTDDNCYREYPRPQMIRDNWVNLCGAWDYAVTAITNTPGRPTKWDGKIRVPYAIESALSGVGRLLEPDEFLWYTRKITCNPKPGKRILLHFEGVDFRAQVFIGHREVTDVPHESGQNPFTIDITDFVTAGENELTVCVWDPTSLGGTSKSREAGMLNSRGKQTLFPSGCFYTRVSGIILPVWMEEVPAKYIKSFRVFPDIDKGTVRFEFDKVEGAGEVAVTTDMPKDFECWSPENPKLYHYTAKYGEDVVKGYFAMRKFSKARDEKGVLRFFLNNKPYFVMGTLDQGWWPDGLLTPPSVEAMKCDIETLKKCGYNTMRKHIKRESMLYYELCDRLGILVLQDMPCSEGDWRAPFRAFTTRGYGIYRAELKQLMDDLQAVPSIVMWIPYNEGWSQPGEFLTHTTLDFVKNYDPTRLVNGPSGCNDFEGGELLNKGWHDRVLTAHKKPGECEAADAVDYHLYRGPTMFVVNDRRVSFLGEFGGLGHPVKGHLWKDMGNGKNWGYGGIADTATKEGLENAYLSLMDRLAVLASQGLGGAIYTQTTDVEIEINGVMTYDRKVLKYNADVLAKAHKRVCDAALGKGITQFMQLHPWGTGKLHLSHVHRGGGKNESPDNTLETFRWCWENGSALECDCRKTADGVGVMLHDDNLKRTARGITPEFAAKSVSKELKWDEIKNVDVGSYLGEKFASHRIPTIEATFAAMKGKPTYLCFVDEKGAGPEMMAKVAIDAGVQDQVYYTGWQFEKIAEWNKFLPNGKSLLWIGAWPKNHGRSERARADTYFRDQLGKLRGNGFKGISAVSIHTYYDPKDPVDPFVPSSHILKEMLIEFHLHGIPVVSIPFMGGEKEETYRKLWDLGFDGFSTDYPSVMFKVIKELKSK